MGSFYTTGATKAAVIKELTEPEGVTMPRVIGNNLWCLGTTAAGGVKVVMLFLLLYSDGDWGYKPLDETMGPYEHDCPKEIILSADKPLNETSRIWRKAALEGRPPQYGVNNA